MSDSVLDAMPCSRLNCSPRCATNSVDILRSPQRSSFEPPRGITMTQQHSDALVFFGATGDLAYKKIFPALQSMIKRGTLEVPVIGVAKAGWNLDQLKARAKDSLEQHGGLDAAAWEKLSSLLRYVDGDYSDSATDRKSVVGGK